MCVNNVKLREDISIFVIFMTYTNFVGEIGITTNFGVSSGEIWDID